MMKIYRKSDDPQKNIGRPRKPKGNIYVICENICPRSWTQLVHVGKSLPPPFGHEAAIIFCWLLFLADFENLQQFPLQSGNLLV